jgi:hypothetical protein
VFCAGGRISAGLRVVLNTAPAAILPAELWPNVDVVTPDQSEATRITGREPARRCPPATRSPHSPDFSGGSKRRSHGNPQRAVANVTRLAGPATRAY